MKKIVLSFTILAALTTASCKKAYECTCEEATSRSYQAAIDNIDYINDANDANHAETTALKNTNKTVSTIDKTSKSAANATCSNSEKTETSNYRNDYNDADNDGNYLEDGVTQTTVIQRTCILEKQ